jgi:NtrC-family two-component system response regulator AlgB
MTQASRRRPVATRFATLEDVERAHVQRALATAGTYEKAAELLGINLTTLWRKRKRWGLS